MNLSELEIGQNALVTSVEGEGALRQHFLDMGLIPGSRVTLVKYAPMGDPMELRIHGYELTLRIDEAKRIRIEDVRDTDPRKGHAPAHAHPGHGHDRGGHGHGNSAAHGHHGAHPASQRVSSDFEPTQHPGLGEPGIFHDRKNEHPLPEGTTMRFALAGNQNSGKTTLFNQLTGSNQHVGNFPGVTVEQKSGPIRGHDDTIVVDLPGIYSLSPYSAEEVVSRSFILEEHPHAIINIVDATNIERNLYLSMQLMELGIPMVLALNMMDELIANGGSVKINLMEQMLGIPVVPISAMRNEGVDELVMHALHVAKYQEPPLRTDFCGKDDHGGAVHRCMHAVMHLIEDHAQRADIPLRFAAGKVIEGDELVTDALELDENEVDAIEHIVHQMEEERGLDRAAAIADMRFSYIRRVCDACFVKPHESREHARSQKIDRLLTGRYTGIPSFIVIMALIFWLTFNVIGAALQDLLASGIDALGELVGNAMAAAEVNDVIQSLVIDGIFNGVGSVLSFVPIIVVLFFFLSLLEDSGYMARVAFLMDKLLRKIGLSGRSIVPMLVGFGCSVPAIMSTRTLPSERDRKMTIMLIPFMSCSAKMPIYAFLTAAFFPHSGALVMVILYFGGILIGIITALVSKNTAFKGEAVPFVMELPNYRVPGLKSVGRLVWDKTADFIHRAFTVIFVATLIVWFFQTFDFGLTAVTDTSQSMLALIAGFIAPIFAPLGLADWRIVTALITGFMAKESVVSTLSVLFGSTAALTATLSLSSVAALLAFCLLYTPCVAAIAAVRRELGGRWALWIIFFQCGVAWVVGAIVKLIGVMLGF